MKLRTESREFKPQAIDEKRNQVQLLQRSFTFMLTLVV